MIERRCTGSSSSSVGFLAGVVLKPSRSPSFSPSSFSRRSSRRLRLRKFSSQGSWVSFSSSLSRVSRNHSRLVRPGRLIWPQRPASPSSSISIFSTRRSRSTVSLPLSPFRRASPSLPSVSGSAHFSCAHSRSCSSAPKRSKHSCISNMERTMRFSASQSRCSLEFLWRCRRRLRVSSALYSSDLPTSRLGANF